MRSLGKTVFFAKWNFENSVLTAQVYVLCWNFVNATPKTNVFFWCTGGFSDATSKLSEYMYLPENHGLS
jgi:hypothetical protein